MEPTEVNSVEDYALFQLFKRHQRLHHRWMDLRVPRENVEGDGLREELQIVDDAIWDELGRRGHPKESNSFEAAYDDLQSIFVQTYIQLENLFNLKT